MHTYAMDCRCQDYTTGHVWIERRLQDAETPEAARRAFSAFVGHVEQTWPSLAAYLEDVGSDETGVLYRDGEPVQEAA